MDHLLAIVNKHPELRKMVAEHEAVRTEEIQGALVREGLNVERVES